MARTTHRSDHRRGLVKVGVDGDRLFGAPTNLAIGGSETWHSAQIR
jgi:hypothetical protein